MFSWPHRSVVGIDISDRTIEALQVKRGFGAPRIVAYSRVELPAGVVADGSIGNPGDLAERLRRLLQQAKPAPIRERACVLGIPESQVFSHVFTLPAALTGESVQRAVLVEAEQHVPVPLAEVYYDVAVVGRTGELQEVRFTATRRTTVHQHLEACRAAGLLPVAIEPESSSLARAFIRRGLGQRDGTLLVDIGARTTNAHLVSHGTVVGSLTIPRAGDHLTAALAAAEKLSPTEAEAKKIVAGFGAGGHSASVAPILIAAVKPIVTELQRYLGYATEHRGVVIRQVTLCGGSALLPGFGEYLQTQLTVPVTVGNPMQRIAASGPVLPAPQAVIFGNVIGLALRGVHRDPAGGGINFLDQAHGRLRRDRRRQFFSLPELDRRVLGLTVAFGLSLLVLGILVWHRYFRPQPLRRVPVVFPAIDWAKLKKPQEHEFVFSYGSGVVAAPGVISARRLTATVDAAADFPATGTTTVATAVNTASVRLVNTSSIAQSLVAATRLEAADGTTVRLAQPTVVPPDGSVVVSVTVPPGTGVPLGQLILPGLPARLQPLVYGETIPTTTGSPSVVSVVSSADVDAARESLRRELERLASEAFVDQLRLGEFLLPLPLPQGELQFTSDVALGTPEPAFHATARQQIAGLAVPREILVEAITKSFGQISDPLASVSFTLGKDVLEDERISVIISTASQPVEK